MGRIQRAGHFVRLRKHLTDELATFPDATVLWPAISPDLLGHLRDIWTTMPALHPDQCVFAVVHRGNLHQMFQRRSTAATAKRLVQRLEGFVFNTEHLAGRCAQWIPEHKRIVIPNTIDEELILTDAEVSEKQAARMGRERLSALFVSHMLPSKGYLDSLEGIILMHRMGFDVEADFVGQWQSPEDRKAFLQRVRDSGLEGRVTHHGSVSSREAMKNLYRNADVLLFPTYYRNEAQPHVLLEALNAGTPVVTTKHAGIPEMIHHEEEGLFVEPRNPPALANAMSRMADPQSWLSYSKQARQRFLRDFTEKDVRERWRKLLREAPHPVFPA